jgi:hypothetical protein
LAAHLAIINDELAIINDELAIQLYDVQGRKKDYVD